MLNVLVLASLAASASAHITSWNKGMYCQGGNDSSVNDQNTNLAVNPLYDLPQDRWWMQRDRGCDLAPPPDGEFLELPAGGSFTTELANNQAFTTLSYDGQFVSDWQDGRNRTEPWVGPGTPPACLVDNPDGLGGELHTHGVDTAAGTAWAISYESDISKVTMDNLVVFSVRYHTPWHRLTTYDVPADLPACPEEGCYCAWLWIPDGCGQPNMYMANHRCTVTNATSTKTLATPKAPVYCEDDDTKCVQGAKQMMAWNQASGDNVSPPDGKTPTYNLRMGFKDGRQDDIFVEADAPTGVETTSSIPAETSTVAAETSTSVAASTSSLIIKDATTTSTEAAPTTTSVTTPTTTSEAAGTTEVAPTTTQATTTKTTTGRRRPTRTRRTRRSCSTSV